jgi:hypothetical protein
MATSLRAAHGDDGRQRQVRNFHVCRPMSMAVAATNANPHTCIMVSLSTALCSAVDGPALAAEQTRVTTAESA